MNLVARLCLVFGLSAAVANAQSATALVPAYIYPSNNSTWQPLYEQIAAHPKVFFTVIVNPNSGPGIGAPDVNYQREITKLHSYSNVRLVGYISTNYTIRPIEKVKADVDAYANWPANLHVDGFFFDEAPIANIAANLNYMKSIVLYARSKQGSGIGKTAAPYVVTNPGTTPQTTAYLKDDPAPDLVLIVEYKHDVWSKTIDANRKAIWDLDADNNQLAVMLHDVPTDLTCAQITSLVNDLKGNVGVGSIWLTNLKGDASYTGWPSAPYFTRYISSLENAGKAC